MPTIASDHAIGRKAPDFLLPDTLSGDTISLADCHSEKGLLVMFLCNHCPYVRHLEKAISALCREYRDRDIGIVAINANDPSSYPADHPDRMTERGTELGYCFPYLFDDDQSAARNWGAVCTPEFYLHDAALTCVYHGRFDDSTPSNGQPVTGADLRQALDHLLANGGEPLSEQHPSMGCSIKWRARKAPPALASPSGCCCH